MSGRQYKFRLTEREFVTILVKGCDLVGALPNGEYVAEVLVADDGVDIVLTHSAYAGSADDPPPVKP